MKKYIPFIFSLIILTGCKNNDRDSSRKLQIENDKEGAKKEISDSTKRIGQGEFSEEAVDLNKKASYLISVGDIKSYQEAIKLLDQAINIDSTYFIAYVNKGTIFIRLEKYNDAIDIYKYLVTFVKQDYPEAFSTLGMLNDKLGNDSLAKKYYKKALEKYNERIRQKQDVLDMAAKAHLVFILNEAKGLKMIDSLINVYPQNEILPILKEQMFLNYDHQKFLDDL